MASEYSRISSRSKGDPGTAGDEGEKNWANLLRDWLPSTYHIRTKGRIMSPEGELSGQVDIVVLKPHYPKRMLDKKIWLSDGVLAVFECKTTLRTRDISKTFDNCAKIKSFTKMRKATPFHLTQGQPVFGILAHSHSWKSSPDEKLTRAVKGEISKTSSPILIPDLICVANLTTMSKWVSITTQPPQIMGGMVISDINSIPPIGSFINQLMKKLSQEDEAIKDISRYFNRVLRGNMSGQGHIWPLNILPEYVISEMNSAGYEEQLGEAGVYLSDL